MILALLAPESLAAGSGGYLYDRLIASGLSARGHTVTAIATAGRSAAELRRDPVLRAADVWIEDELGHDLYRQLHELPGQRPPALAIVHIPTAILSAIAPTASERDYLASVDAMVFPSERLVSDVEDVFAAIDVPFKVIAPGSDHLPRAARTPAGGALRVIAVAHALPHKRHDLAIDAVDLARSVLGPGRIRLELWASSPDPALAARIARLGDDGSLRGRGEPTDIATALARADVFVLASVYESYGIAAAEALRAGTVVVSCARGGCEHFLRHGDNALITAAAAEPLAGALIELARDRDLVARLAEGTQRSPLSTWDAATAAFDDFVREVLAAS